jgi:hypothetical protein
MLIGSYQEIIGKHEVSTLSRKLGDKSGQEFTDQHRRYASWYGRHAEASVPFVARTSERAPVAYTRGTDSSKDVYIGFLSERRQPPPNPQLAKIGSGTLIG